MIHRREFLKGTTLAGGLAAIHPQVLWSRTPRGRSTARLTENNAAATVHPLATQAAMDVMQEGGNAIDGAIAAALVLGVVDGHNSGIGGGCLALIRLAEGRVRAIDGRETAGAAASPNMFFRDGKPDPDLSQTGSLACGVPGQIAAMHRMHQAHGMLPWEGLFDYAIQAAEGGHPVSASTARTIASEFDSITRFPASRSVLLAANGKPLREGEPFVQTDLANTLKKIARHGAEWFYRDGFAKTCCEYLSTIGGILTEQDFARYQSLDRTPIATHYRGNSIIGFPPPSSGGIHIAQMLNMLEGYLVSLWFEEKPARGYHLLAEVMKRAFADRAYWLGDSDFVDVPSTLIDREYANDRMQNFSETRMSSGIEHGIPKSSNPRLVPAGALAIPEVDGKHTTHLTVADSMGNWVAMTCTVNTSWGSKVMVPGTGVMLNNQMDDFSIAPGTPNAFGLVGSYANAVAPGKRPLSSMSPTVVLDSDGLPLVTCGAAGGPRIINATLQVLVQTLDLSQSIADAIAAPRIHHQWRPDTLWLEKGIDPNVVRELRAKGHEVKESPALGIAQGIHRRDGRLFAAHDPRAEGASAS